MDGPLGEATQGSQSPDLPGGLHGDLLDPDDYRASHIFGAERRAAGSNGITWPSLRYPGGHCIAVFWPDVVPIPTPGAQFAYHWNGSAVDYVRRLDTGEIWQVT